MKKIIKGVISISIFKSFFRVKSIDYIMNETNREKEHFSRTLTWVDLVFLGVGAIIGAGIFTTVGSAAAGDIARPGAGPSLIISFILTGIACGFSALCYAEFAAMVPIAGSAYTYSYATLGEFIAWIIGWDIIVEYAIGSAAVSISWSGYFCSLLKGFGIHIPLWLTVDYRTALTRGGIVDTAPHIFGIPIVFNLPAVFILTALAALIIIGVKESARFNEIIVGIKLLVLVFFCGVGYFYINGANYTPFAPNGWAGIQTGAAIVFLAYIGFDAVSTLAEETKNPGRDLPIGILGSLAICTIVYIAVTAVFTGLVPFAELQKKMATEKAEPLAMALKYIGSLPTASALAKSLSNSAAVIVALGSIIAQTAVILVLQMGLPRIIFSMSRDGLLPKVFMKIHKKFKTPYVSTVIVWAVITVLAATMNLDELIDLCNIGTLFAFILVCLGILVLRFKDPDHPRPFKAPGGIVTPICGMLTCLYLTVGLPYTSWIRFGVWLCIGLVVYLSYGIKHSHLNPDMAAIHEKELAQIEVPKDIDKF